MELAQNSAGSSLLIMILTSFFFGCDRMGICPTTVISTIITVVALRFSVLHVHGFLLPRIGKPSFSYLVLSYHFPEWFCVSSDSNKLLLLWTVSGCYCIFTQQTDKKKSRCCPVPPACLKCIHRSHATWYEWQKAEPSNQVWSISKRATIWHAMCGASQRIIVLNHLTLTQIDKKH